MAAVASAVSIAHGEQAAQTKSKESKHDRSPIAYGSPTVLLSEAHLHPPYKSRSVASNCLEVAASASMHCGAIIPRGLFPDVSAKAGTGAFGSACAAFALTRTGLPSLRLSRYCSGCVSRANCGFQGDSHDIHLGRGPALVFKLADRLVRARL